MIKEEKRKQKKKKKEKVDLIKCEILLKWKPFSLALFGMRIIPLLQNIERKI